MHTISNPNRELWRMARKCAKAIVHHWTEVNSKVLLLIYVKHIFAIDWNDERFSCHSQNIIVYIFSDDVFNAKYSSFVWHRLHFSPIHTNSHVRARPTLHLTNRTCATTARKYTTNRFYRVFFLFSFFGQYFCGAEGNETFRKVVPRLNDMWRNSFLLGFD